MKQKRHTITIIPFKKCTFEPYIFLKMERIEKLKEMIKTNSKDCFLWHALGLEFLKLNEIETAINYFKEVVSIDENYVGTYYHLAKSFEKINQTEDAINIYKKGIVIAQKVKDNHAKNELQMALDDLIDE